MDFDFSWILLGLPVAFTLGWLASRMDLRQLLGLLPAVAQPRGILAPHSNDAALQESIALLRKQGHAVVVDLLGDAALRNELNCDRELILRDAAWVVVALNN